MNLALSDPYSLAQEYPEYQTSTLKSGHVTCVRFNRKGDFLAAGRTDGKVVIFDMDVSSVARKLKGHTRQIQSLSWSRCGRYLLTGAMDWKVNLWDLATGEAIRTVRFEGPVYTAELHPHNHLMFASSLYDDQPMLVDISDPIPIKYDIPSAPKRTALNDDGGDPEKKAVQDAKMLTTVAVFTPSGRYLLAGTNKGWLNLVNLDISARAVIYSQKLCNGVITMLRLSNSGRDVVINASDRIIRTLHLPDLTPPDLDYDTIDIEAGHKFQDVVNKLAWNHVAFSASGDYVIASTFNNHDVYIFECTNGTLIKILEGPKEEHGVVEWHPHRPLIVGCAIETGRCHIWSIIPQQRWSALAPDFVEVEENVEYVESEDEFDIHDKEELHKRRLDMEDEEIDLWSVTRVEGEEDSFNLPLLSDVSDSGSEDELIAIGRGEMRRKSPGAGRDYALEGDVDSEWETRKKAAKRKR